MRVVLDRSRGIARAAPLRRRRRLAPSRASMTAGRGQTASRRAKDMPAADAQHGRAAARPRRCLSPTTATRSPPAVARRRWCARTRPAARRRQADEGLEARPAAARRREGRGAAARPDRQALAVAGRPSVHARRHRHPRSSASARVTSPRLVVDLSRLDAKHVSGPSSGARRRRPAWHGRRSGCAGHRRRRPGLTWSAVNSSKAIGFGGFLGDLVDERRGDHDQAVAIAQDRVARFAPGTRAPAAGARRQARTAISARCAWPSLIARHATPGEQRRHGLRCLRRPARCRRGRHRSVGWPAARREADRDGRRPASDAAACRAGRARRRCACCRRAGACRAWLAAVHFSLAERREALLAFRRPHLLGLVVLGHRRRAGRQRDPGLLGQGEDMDVGRHRVGLVERADPHEAHLVARAASSCSTPRPCRSGSARSSGPCRWPTACRPARARRPSARPGRPRSWR